MRRACSLSQPAGRRFACWLILCCGTIPAPAVFAQEPTDKPVDTTFIDAARAYTLRPARGDGAFALQELEALRWTNPIRGSAAGTVFIWTDRGRPIAAASMYSYDPGNGRKVDHEFVSLSESGFVAEMSGSKVWAPSKGGVRWTALDKAPAPAATRPARLTQMRLIASRFEGTLIQNGERDRLRLLTQPIYRFPETPTSDGAIFALAQATDPEILLLVDVDLAGSPPRYRYAAARMSSNALQLSHDGTTVLEIEKWAWGSTEPDQPYITRINVPVAKQP